MSITLRRPAELSGPRGPEIGAGQAPPPERAARVLVVFEASPNGVAALNQAVDLVDRDGAQLTVVSLARQDGSCRCGPSPEPLNLAVREAAQADLGEARQLLGAAAGQARLLVLTGRPEPPLAGWVRQQGFDLVLLPRHRLTPGGHSGARRLRRRTSAQVRLVG